VLLCLSRQIWQVKQVDFRMNGFFVLSVKIMKVETLEQLSE